MRRPRSLRSFIRTAALGLLLWPILAAASDLADCCPACDPVDGWQQFERRVKEDAVSPEQGRAEIACWAVQLEKRFPAQGFGSKIHFPVEGYGPKQIGGRQGEAYQAKSYEFVGERRRRGHPAQDIFVYDGNLGTSGFSFGSGGFGIDANAMGSVCTSGGVITSQADSPSAPPPPPQEEPPARAPAMSPIAMLVTALSLWLLGTFRVGRGNVRR